MVSLCFEKSELRNGHLLWLALFLFRLFRLGLVGEEPEGFPRVPFPTKFIRSLVAGERKAGRRLDFVPGHMRENRSADSFAEADWNLSLIHI